MSQIDGFDTIWICGFFVFIFFYDSLSFVQVFHIILDRIRHTLFLYDRFGIHAILIRVASIFKGIEITLCQNLFGFVQMSVVILLGLYLGIIAATN